MILVSLRSNFDGSIGFAVHPRARIGNGQEISMAEVARRVKGKRVLVLIHGYHNSVSDTMDSFGTIVDTLRDRGLVDEGGDDPLAYQLVIGLQWPCSSLYLGFVTAWGRAARAGSMLADLLENWAAEAVDVETHSLGARVALEAISYPQGYVRNLILTEPAVHADVFNKPGGQYAWSTASSAKQILVCYSKHDDVLRYAFRACKWTRALGLYGPSGATSANVHPVDCSLDVDCHAAPKRSEILFSAWKELLCQVK